MGEDCNSNRMIRADIIWKTRCEQLLEKGKETKQTAEEGNVFPGRGDSRTESPRNGRPFTVVISHLYFDCSINLSPSLNCNLQKVKDHICFGLLSLQHPVQGLAQSRCSENIW